MEYKRYPKYKISGVEWLRGVPEHWGVYPGKRVFAQKRDGALPEDEQLTASQKYGVIPQKMFMENEGQKVALALAGSSNFRHVEKDDFVISLRSFQGGIERSRYPGCVTPAYTVLRAAREDFEPRYYEFLLKAYPYIQALQSSTDSLRDGKAISYDAFGMIPIPTPSRTEQESIAEFLDHETTSIDALIEKKQRLIELLKEKRQAVITQAVTKGLDPNVPMKDSGVEWLGEVPEHWQTKQIRHLVSFIGGGTPSKENEDYWQGNIPWVSPKDMKTDTISSALDNITFQAVTESSTTLIAKGAVLIVVRGMILLHSVPVALTEVNLTINQDMKALVPNKAISAKYLLYLLKGFRDIILNLMDSSAHGTRVLPTENFKRLVVAVPRIDEQAEITTFIESQLSIFDRLQERTTKSIELLREHRSALITAAVTGQIDVRNTA
ncbi:MAG: restriction endonuclease subunit S [Candidatus Thiodiazotropha taylori]